MTTERGEASIWDDERSKVLSLLRQLDPTIGDAYRSAVELLGVAPQSGGERVRLAIIGHCFRELMNNLPEVLRDVEDVPPRGGNSDKSEDDLVEAFRSFRESSLKETVAKEEIDGLPEFISVPTALMASLIAFEASHGSGTRRSRQRDAMVVLKRLDISDPALGPWIDARNFFVSIAHLNLEYATSREVPADAEVLEHVSIFEASICARLDAFFSNVHALGDLLALANRPRVEAAL